MRGLNKEPNLVEWVTEGQDGTAVVEIHVDATNI